MEHRPRSEVPEEIGLVFHHLTRLLGAAFAAATISVAAFSVFPLAAAAEEQDRRELLAGPFETANQQPLELMHRTFVPTSPFVLSPGALYLSLDGDWANTVDRRRRSYLFDAETRSLRPSARFGLTDRLEIGADLPVLWRGGGITDDWLDGYHQTLGLPRGPRQFVADDTFVLQGVTENDGTYRETRQGTGLMDAELTLKAALLQSDTWNASLLLQASLPTGRSSYGQSSTDVNIGALTAYKFSNVWILAGAAYSYLFDPWQANLEFNRQQYRGYAGLSYFLSDRFSIYAGLNAGSSFIKNIRSFPDYQIYADLGVRHRFGERTFVSASFRENPAPSQGTTDIAFELGVGVLFF